ncbi:MAG: DUF3782 domain-containing protein, partial [bacterium]|nr:DUF3782 domain-containing protein [bacterium]
ADKGFELQSKATRELEAKADKGFELQSKATRELEAKVDKGFELQSKATRELEAKVDKGFELQSKATRELEAKVDKGFELQSKTTRDLGIKVDTVGARWGIFAESTIRNTLKELLLKDLKVTEVTEWKTNDKDGFVFGYPQEIQIDLLLKNGEHYLVEIKSSAGSGDVTLFSRKVKFYTQVTGVLPRMIFVAVNMNEEGRRSCQELNIQLITYEELKD